MHCLLELAGSVLAPFDANSETISLAAQRRPQKLRPGLTSIGATQMFPLVASKIGACWRQSETSLVDKRGPLTVFLAAGPRSIRPTTTHRGHRPENSLHHVNKKFSRVSAFNPAHFCGKTQDAKLRFFPTAITRSSSVSSLIVSSVKRALCDDLSTTFPAT